MPTRSGKPKREAAANNGTHPTIVPTQGAVESPSAPAVVSDGTKEPGKPAPIQASGDHVITPQSPAAPESTSVEPDAELNSAIRQVLESLLKDDDFVKQLTRTIQGKLLNDLKESICQEVLDSLEFNSANQGDVMAAMRKEIEELKEMNDDAEQYYRRTCLVLSGVPERMNENTDSRIIQLCKEGLGVDVQMDDVERSHRLGQQKSQSEGSTKPRTRTTSHSHTPRNIIVKFNSYRTREQVYSARFKLKNLSDENNHHVYINESLTKKRKELLLKAIQLPMIRNFPMVFSALSCDGRAGLYDCNKEYTTDGTCPNGVLANGVECYTTLRPSVIGALAFAGVSSVFIIIAGAFGIHWIRRKAKILTSPAISLSVGDQDDATASQSLHQSA